MPSIEVTRRNGQRHTILFDDEDAALVLSHHWHVRTDPRSRDLYYAVTHIEGRKVRMHALILDQADVDHINHNGLDNRRTNLRRATRSQQGANRLPGTGYSSRFKGVSRERGRWRAYIRINGKRVSLGMHEDEIEAARVYDRAARNAWGEHALTNL